MVAKTRTRTAVAEVGRESGTLRQFLSNVFYVMALGLLITGVVSMLLAGNPDMMKTLYNSVDIIKDGKTTSSFTASWWWYGAVGLQLLMVIGLSWFGITSGMSLGAGLVVFSFYSALTGFTLAPVMYVYTTASIAKAFFITGTMFGGCALWGHTTKRDLTPYGSFFLAALIGLLVLMVANIFLRSPASDYIVSGIAVLLFSALTAYDMQMLEKLYEEEGKTYTGGLVVFGALSLYLDFLNMFLHILRFVGVPIPGGKSDD